MTLPVVPGNSMSFSQINTELGLSSTATISLNDAAVRTLAGVGASPAAIAITNLSGKSNQFSFTISTNQTNANLRTLALNAGWPGTAKVVATINSGIYISSNSTSTPALTVSGSFPNGVELINQGFIIGMGGNGNGRNVQAVGFVGIAGDPGGGALSVSSAISVNNTGTIGGGGGGGGNGGSSYNNNDYDPAGYFNGGGGGGRSSNAANSSGGISFNNQGNGGAGTVNGAGAGGAGIPFNGGFSTVPNGGAGGDWGSAGVNGTGGNYSAAGAGGSGGYAISGNSYITYIATGTRLGSIS
jgi:hypothetical protein